MKARRTETAILNWKVSREDAELIVSIAERVRKLSPFLKMHDVVMDLTACHLNGCPLDLAGLLDADNAHFTHDVYGIMEHLDRSTGKLTGFFTPRFAAEAKP